jgi:hypothetical protein
MVSPRDSVDLVARAIAESGDLPDNMGVVLEEADLENEHSDVDLPTLEIQIAGVDNVVLNNSDFAGYVTDDNGNRTGRVYRSEYEMEIDVSIWTNTGGGYSPDELGEKLREALYPYSSYGEQRRFRDENGNCIDDVTYFRLLSGDRVDELLRTPNARVWQQTLELWAFEEFKTTEEYITSVEYPEAEQFNDDDDDGIIEYQHT